MTTIPARLARATTTSSNPTEARQRVLSLYRNWYRSVSPPNILYETPRTPTLTQRPTKKINYQAPEICTLYALNVSPTYLRHVIRQKFERNRSVTDPKIIDVLIAKERMEYQETMNCWKMNDQLLGLLLQPDGGKPVDGTFLERFYQGERRFLSFLFILPRISRSLHRVSVPFSSTFSASDFDFRLGVFDWNIDYMRLGRDEQAVRPAATGM